MNFILNFLIRKVKVPLDSLPILSSCNVTSEIYI